MDSFSGRDFYRFSRWTQGNFFFPTQACGQPAARHPHQIHGCSAATKKAFRISKVASVHITTGVFWSEIVIESTGGTDPITSHGHRKAEAQRIRDLIETYQAQSRG